MNNAACLLHDIDATVVAPKAQLLERPRHVNRDTVTVTLEVRSPLHMKAGVDRIVGRDVVQVRDGLIRAIRFVPDFADEPTAAFFATLGIGPRAAKPAVRP